MLVLLPPSEGKTRPSARRAPLALTRLSWPELTAAREQVLDALAAASARSDAHEILGVAASLADEVAANTGLRATPAAAAGEVYSGVLYDALDLASLAPPARRRAARRLVVVSALWGAVRVGDRVPAYRLSMAVALPGIGPLAAFWRPQLDGPLTQAAGRGLVVDCRSTTYQAAWTPPVGLIARTVAIRVLSEQDGRRTVVSHMAKHARGLVARHLLERDREPRTVAALASAVAEAFDCQLVEPATTRRAWTLDVVMHG